MGKEKENFWEMLGCSVLIISTTIAFGIFVAVVKYFGLNINWNWL
jgi:hypothetical protein